MMNDTMLASVEPAIKEQAEAVLNRVGMSMDELIFGTMLLIAREQDVPELLKVPPHPNSMDNMTKEQFEEAINEGLRDIEEGRVMPFEEVIARFNKDYGYSL